MFRYLSENLLIFNFILLNLLFERALIIKNFNFKLMMIDVSLVIVIYLCSKDHRRQLRRHSHNFME